MEALKRFAKKIPFFNEWARTLYFLITGRWKSDIGHWLEASTRNLDKAFIVQIGSNDGSSGDPLYRLLMKKRSWNALLVEPVPYLFGQLKRNYCDKKRFTLENSAINNGDKLPFYWLDPSAQQSIPGLPGWFNQINSFNRQHIINHLGAKIEPFINVTEITGLTLPGLFTKHKLHHVDILHLDTEGYDWQILSQLEMHFMQPSVILFEFEHLDDFSKKAALDFLIEKYFLFLFKLDLLAIHKQHHGLTQAEMKVLCNFEIPNPVN